MAKWNNWWGILVKRFPTVLLLKRLAVGRLLRGLVVGLPVGLRVHRHPRHVREWSLPKS